MVVVDRRRCLAAAAVLARLFRKSVNEAVGTEVAAAVGL
jgi:hypothetical protein